MYRNPSSPSSPPPPWCYHSHPSGQPAFPLPHLVVSVAAISADAEGTRLLCPSTPWMVSWNIWLFFIRCLLLQQSPYFFLLRSICIWFFVLHLCRSLWFFCLNISKLKSWTFTCLEFVIYNNGGYNYYVDVYVSSVTIL